MIDELADLTRPTPDPELVKLLEEAANDLANWATSELPCDTGAEKRTLDLVANIRAKLAEVKKP